MIISTKGRYALRVMIDLAEHQTGAYIPLKEIAERQEISEKYLEAILKVLVRERFLIGMRGKGGGYKLSRAPEQYTVGSIIRLTEGSLAPVSCADGVGCCERADRCVTVEVWREIQAAVDGVVDHLTLADLVRRYHEKFGGRTRL